MTHTDTTPTHAALGLVDSDAHGNRCQCCGAHCPKRLVALAVLDADGNNTGGVVFFGVVCAARACKLPAQLSPDKAAKILEAHGRKRKAVDAARALWSSRVGHERLARFAATRATLNVPDPAPGVTWQDLVS